MEKTQSNKVQKILFWTTIAFTVIFALASYFLFILQSGRVFSDFAETLSYCIVKNPYSGEYANIHSIYPPFAYLPFYLFALIAKKPISAYLAGEFTLSQLCDQPTFILSFVLFFVLCLAVVLFLAAKISKFKGKKLAYLLICITLFSPILYSFVRGNNIISALILIMLFFWLYNSEKRWHREIANLCLAGAIAIKIYPILIILFFIKDRRFLDLLKTIGYALVLLFIPFLLVDGGFGNIKHIWNNFTKFNSGESRQLNKTNISLDALASSISLTLADWTGSNMDGLYSILSKILRFGLVLSTIVTFILSKKSKLIMQTILLSLLTYELFMGVSYSYTLIFLTIPIIYFLKDFDNYSLFDKLFYGICFLFIACPIFACIKDFRLIRYVLLILAVKAIVDLIIDFSRQRKIKKQTNQSEQTQNIEPEVQENV